MLSLKEKVNQVHAPYLTDMETSCARLCKRVKVCKTHAVALEIQQGEILAQFSDDFQEIQDACDHICSKVKSATAHFMKHTIQEILSSSKDNIDIYRKRHVLD